MPPDRHQQLRDAVRSAHDRGAPLCIRGAGSKDFLGRAPRGEPLDVGEHRGIVDYAPTELVVTVRAGTPLDELETELAARRQMLAFEPPRFGAGATIGGTVACALAGPRRAFAGGVRDALLGCRLLDGRGELMHFGGEVMKNVAGYDVSRLMAGAMGTLGVLLELSLRVVPCPETSLSLQQQCGAAEGLQRMRTLCRRPWPLAGLCHDGETLFIRLAGSAAGVEAAARAIGGEPLDEGVWTAIREQTHPFFADTLAGDAALWRLDLAPASPLPAWGRWFIDWAGYRRWLITDREPAAIHAWAETHGGHARLFRRARHTGEAPDARPPALRALHQRLKAAFDPRGILNPGRLHAEPEPNPSRN